MANTRIYEVEVEGDVDLLDVDASTPPTTRYEDVDARLWSRCFRRARRGRRCAWKPRPFEPVTPVCRLATRATS